MPSGPQHLSAADLRREFDAAFALPRPEPARRDDLRLLGALVAGVEYALPIEQIASFGPLRPPVPIPSRAAALLGLAPIGGAVVAALDLGALLGHRRADRDACRWAVGLATGGGVAFAFDAPLGHLAARADQAQPIAGERAHPACSRIVLVGDRRWPILDLSRLRPTRPAP